MERILLSEDIIAWAVSGIADKSPLKTNRMRGFGMPNHTLEQDTEGP